jgi:hypothetical protein
MGGVVRFLRLQAQVRTGLSSGLLVWALLGIVFGVLAFIFVIASAFIWLGERFGPLAAALSMAAFFLLITIIALTALLLARNATRRQAALELAERKRAIALDPTLIGVALQVGRATPWRWAAPAAAIIALAAGIGVRMLGRQPPHIEEAKEKLQKAEDRLQRAEDRLRREYAKAA